MWNGGIIEMIRELTKSEIKTVEDYIQLVFKNNSDYKYYFFGQPKKKYSDRGFLLGNGQYYCDVEVINGISFVGICKLQAVKNNYYLTNIISLFERLYKEYGIIGIWRDINNTRVIRLHEHIKRRFKKRGEVVLEDKKGDISVFVIKKRGDKI